MDVYAQAPITLCLGNATLVAGTTSTITNSAVAYTINGKTYSKAGVSNGATPTTDAATGLAFVPLTANKGCTFLIGYNAANVMLVTQGDLVDLSPAGNFMYAPNFGPVPNDFCPVGYEVVKAGSTAVGSWTFGTSVQTPLTGMTYTFTNITTLPDRPQVS
jgi:hypothetical protein